MEAAYIVASYRTPGCRAKKGAFRQLRPDDLGAVLLKGLLKKTRLNPEQIEDLIVGCAFPEGEQGLNLARIIALRAGLPVTVPAMTINRFCASGLQTIAIAANQIMAGNADCVIAGGVESMSSVPIGGNKYSANPELVKNWPESYVSMGITAELLSDRYAITREAMDQFAFSSHQKASQATKTGLFQEEIIPIEVETTELNNNKTVHDKKIIDKDDGIRPDTTPEALARLKPAFRVNGLVTAGNSSQMTDGAAFSLIVSEHFLKENQLDPIARFLAYSVSGCPPEYMGLGPVTAVPEALKKAKLPLKEIELIELNEAFAVQSLAVIEELKLNREIINTNGGAIALGHPLGCTGAKLTTTLLHTMKRQNNRYGLVTMCVGGGMGAAGIFERT